MSNFRHEWNAETYDALPLPHVEWGRRVVACLELKGDEHVIEAGVGTGRDAELLLDRIPSGRLTAMDGSENMLAVTRQRLARFGDRVTSLLADFNEPLPVGEPVDAIYSVATFHWLLDHDRLFTHLAQVLRPGGQLAFDCGGKGNVAEIERAVSAIRGGEPMRWNFRDAAQTRASLEGAGFEVRQVQLRPHRVSLPDRASFERFLDVISLGRETQGMDASTRTAFVQAVADRLPGNEVVFVRLEATARRR